MVKYWQHTPPYFCSVNASTSSILLRNISTPFNGVNALVVGCLGVAYAIHADTRLLLDALGIFTVVLSNTLIAIVQEIRAHAALERIVVATLPPKTAIRVGDVLEIRRGSVLEADGSVLQAEGCEMDQSLLTGESAPFQISAGHHVHAGTVCVAGYARIEVTATGADTAAHKIEVLGRTINVSLSPLQRRVNKIFVVSFLAALLLAIVDVAFHFGTAFTSVDHIRRTATLVLGVIPEGLVFFSTITMTMGLVRIARHGVVVQRLSALEAFASVNTVCLDKTGTLTTNTVALERIVPIANTSERECRGLLGSYVCSFSGNEGSLAEAIRLATPNSTAFDVESAEPFSSERKRSSITTTSGVVYTLCAVPPSYAHVLAQHHVAHKRCLLFLADTQPLCVLVFHDPLRAESADTLQQFRDMGIQTTILTGDTESATADILQQLNASETPAYTRCTPEFKREFVAQLKSIAPVAMVGDGVNDLPALREATVGIALHNAAPATKLVADVVLEKSTFAAFPEMIGEGRATIRTILSVAKLFLAKNVVLTWHYIVVLCGFGAYPWTPRRGALLSVVTVALPSIYLAIHAPSRGKTPRFFVELFLFVASIGAACIVGASLAPMLVTAIPPDEAVLFATLGAMSAAFCLVDQMTLHQRAWAAALGVSTIILVAVFADVVGFVPFLAPVAAFYEIDTLTTPVPLALGAAAIGCMCSILMYTAYTLFHTRIVRT